MSETFRAKLLVATSVDDVVQAINDQDKMEDSDGSNKADSGKYIIAITACMTGIAHTYLAAESLKEAAAKRSMKVKIQTNGANGPENSLTAADVRNADAIIVAHDVAVDTSILNHKQFVDVPVKKAINQADQLIDQALSYEIKTAEEVQNPLSQKSQRKNQDFNFTSIL